MSPSLPTGVRYLRERYGLADFDLDLLLLAVAPELDLRYQCVFGHLQAGQPRPTVQLALDLFCADPADRLARLAGFATSSPLFAAGLLRLRHDPAQPDGPLPSHRLLADPQVVDLVLGAERMDRRLTGWCRVLQPDPVELPWEPPGLAEFAAAAVDALRAGRGWYGYVSGPVGSGRSTAARALAGAAKIPLMEADLTAAPPDLAELLPVLFREAELFGAGVFLRHLDPEEPRWAGLLRWLPRTAGLVLLSGTGPTGPAVLPGGMPLAVLTLDHPDRAGRAACWRRSLAAQEIELPAAELESLAGGFRLTPGQIEAAVVIAAVAVSGTAGPDDLRAAAREQTGRELARLARRRRPRARWADLVLPEETLVQLRELCERAAGRARVLDDWGFGAKLSGGTGATALFLGPSGTGKTFAAEALAGELGLDLFQIDLAQVVSKYIGETEKNLDQVFRAAADANGVLFFDEAEALFAKRGEVKDAHDRYANIEVAYLLQKMEEYTGIAILATNLRHTLDEAFLRRLAFCVHFPFPDADSRERLWNGVWPAAIPLAPDLDFAALAAEFPLSGGNIKNVALAAAFGAAADGGVVTAGHLRHAVRREYQKLGRELARAELTIGGAS